MQMVVGCLCQGLFTPPASLSILRVARVSAQMVSRDHNRTQESKHWPAATNPSLDPASASQLTS